MQLRSEFHTLPDKSRMRYVVVDPEAACQRTIVVFPGRREFIEKKIFEIGAFCHDHKFQMIVFEWRGHGLSDRFLKGEERQRDHIDSFDTYLADFRSFYQDVVIKRAKGPILALAHSMGAHCLLRWLALDQPSTITHAILTAPMLALGSPGFEMTSKALAWAAIKRGFNTRYALFQHDYNDRDRAFLNNPLSHDQKRFGIVETYFDHTPELRVGGVTWGWLWAASRSLKQLRSQDQLKSVRIPNLIFTGEHDIVTPARGIEPWAQQLPHCDYVSFKGSRHDILNEKDPIPQAAFEKIANFLSLNR